MKRKDTIPDEVKTITADELDGLVQRVSQSPLSDADKQLLVGFVRTVATLRAILERRSIGLKSFLRKVFGVKTEKRRRRKGDDEPPSPPGTPPGDSPLPGGSGGPATPSSSTAGGSPPPAESKRKGGDGRNGRDDYPGAKRERITHATLGPGSPCPVCPDGTLAELTSDAVAYRWTGSLPLHLTIYDLQRLICHWCKTTYTATPPGETPDATALDPSLPEIAGRVEERSATPEATASIATLRFEMGVPHYRLADAQAAQGVPLPPSTQVKMMEPLREPAEAVFGLLEKLAGSGKLVIPDDTHVRVLDVERGKVMPPGDSPAQSAKKPKELLRPKKEGEESVKGPRATTSAVISHLSDGRTICLHYTGFAQAGENLAKCLAHRAAGMPPPLQMCDALEANLPKGFVTILGNCLDHARRLFYDLDAYYPAAVDEVLTRLGRVYAFDAEAKRLGLPDDERLAWHQLYSAPEMGELWLWADGIKHGKDVMPNSPLRRPVNYLLKHWDELTLFLREPGAPLSSAEVERLIKRCIRHRKNSLQYKTLRGARFGDLMMSLIQTCRYAGQSAHAYLAALVRHATAVRAAPDSWLPWNYQAALATAPPASSGIQ
jgi:transposase